MPLTGTLGLQPVQNVPDLLTGAAVGDGGPGAQYLAERQRRRLAIQDEVLTAARWLLFGAADRYTDDEMAVSLEWRRYLRAEGVLWHFNHEPIPPDLMQGGDDGEGDGAAG